MTAPSGSGAAGPSRGGAAGDSPVDDYLDRLLVAAPGPPRQVRALLAEAETHLRDATDDGVGRGLERSEAERQAVARFGTVRIVADAEARRQELPFGTLVRQIITSALLLGGIAGVAVGASGVVVAAMELVGSKTFIVNISSHTYLARSDCARWLAGYPGVHSCYQAALNDWASDTIMFRLFAGVLGVMALAAYLLLRRRRRFGDLPASVVDTIAVTVYGLAGLWSLGLGVDLLIQQENGAGGRLAVAPFALALALYYGLRLMADVRRAPVGTAV